MKQCRVCKTYVDGSRTACRRCGDGTLDYARLVIDGRYLVERELGRGGMGVVYLATDLGLGRRVAVKVIAPAFVGDASVNRRFRREAAALASLRHPHVVQVYALGGAPQAFFAMEYVRGASLAAIIGENHDRGGTMPVRRALTIVRQIASALDAVHAAGALHRDVKPENIVVEEGSGRPVLIDFGLVSELGCAVTARRGYGTPQYMAPEQGPHAADTGVIQITRSADVYSLACTTYELLCGELPFDSETREPVFFSHAYEEPPLLSTYRADLAALDPVFEQALRKDPSTRFASAGEFSRALDRAGAAWCMVDAPPAPKAAVPSHAEDAIRILVVDDDEHFRRYAGRAAQLAFYQRRIVVRQAHSADEAIDCIAREPPHLILLDYAMPGLNGVETLSIAREMPGGSDARVIVLSANAREEQRGAFAALGVSDFVEKPVGFKPLVALISSIGARNGWLEAPELPDVQSVHADAAFAVHELQRRPLGESSRGSYRTTRYSR